MAFIFGDTFDGYANADILTKWTTLAEVGNAGGTTHIGAYGRRSTQGMRLYTTSSGQRWTRAYSVAFANYGPAPGDNKVVLCFATRPEHPLTNMPTTPSNGFGLFSVREGSAPQFYVFPHQDGTLRIFRGGTTSSPLITTTQTQTQNVYDWWEIEYVIHASAGSVRVKKNGVYVDGGGISGVNTRGAAATGNTWTQGWIGPIESASSASSPSIDQWFDDVMFMDGTGTRLNGFVGDSRGDILLPNGAGANNMSTPSTGTDRSATVDEALTNGDTDYNTFAAVNDKDTYAMGNHPVPGSTIHVVQQVNVTKKTDVGAALAAGVIRISGTDYVGDDRAPSTDYAGLRQVWGVSPATTNPFTTTELDGAEMGLKRTA